MMTRSGYTMRKIELEERNEIKETYLKRIVGVMYCQGFASLKIQDIAQLMNISKATLYNYFSSKEEIIQEMAAMYIDYINDVDQVIVNTELSYPLRFQKVFNKTAVSILSASNLFIRDLKISCPETYEEMLLARKNKLNSIEQFYKSGIKDGVFYNLNTSILVVQNEETFRKLLDPYSLSQMGLSLKQALYDFYEMKKVQLFKPEFLVDFDDEPIHNAIDHIVYKSSSSQLKLD
jgi:AcrR family transcriptional regulator